MQQLQGDMYVLLAGEVDIETDLGVVQVPFLELTCRGWTWIIALKICCPVFLYNYIILFILYFFAYIWYVHIWYVHRLTFIQNKYIYIYIRLFNMSIGKIPPFSFHILSNALRRACCLARFLAKGPWEHTCNGTPRHVRGLLRWGAQDPWWLFPQKNEHG